MSATIHINEYLVESITVEPNTEAEPDLIVLQVRQRCGGHAEDARFVMNGRELWQRVVDQLALLGITPTVSTGSAYECGRCAARFGIAGVNTGSDEDVAAEEQYRADVDYHESGHCVVVPFAPEVPC